MVLKQNLPKLRPPYPESPPLRPSEPQTAIDTTNPPYSPSLMDSPAFDLKGLGEALIAQRTSRGSSLEGNRAEMVGRSGIPESLRVGIPGKSEAGPQGVESRRNLERSNIPEALKVGGGRRYGEEMGSSSYGSTKDQEVKPLMHGALESNPVSERRVDKGKERMEEIPASYTSSIPPQMSANITSADRPFSEYSPFYASGSYPSTTTLASNSYAPSNSHTAPNSYTNSNSFIASNSYTPSNSNTIFDRPGNSHTEQSHMTTATSFNSDVSGHQNASVSSMSSAGFEPGADISSFDASYARALPGRRGMPTVGMAGWEEGEEEERVTKTWEEELDQRAEAGKELQRRTEEAQLREREQSLQAEFWEEERKEQERIMGGTRGVEGPPKPPKEAEVLSVNVIRSTDTTVETPRAETFGEKRPVPPPPPPPAQTQQDHTRHSPPPPAQTQQNHTRHSQPSATTTTEIYQIKHINWADPNFPTLRRSPILMQNANGPCPLLALVNALILTTPPGAATSLGESLRLREQVSLELLLDVVFEELMNRGGYSGLPDVSDLFAFLLTLHTGMNVNPRFLPESEGSPAPGGFEHTREMTLYGAFRIPLVHGWVPAPSHPAIPVMRRRNATSYEECQNILLQEEEIILRLSTQGGELTTDEQNLCEDAQAIRDFLQGSATQLTEYGLEAVRSMKNGEVGILFRNDHFMTIYKEPRNGGLMGLVTDMGYAGHDEVVWERLVDVNGRDNEFCSGDFRPVGGGGSSGGHGNQREGGYQQQQTRSMVDIDASKEGWEIVPPRNNHANQPSIGQRLDNIPPPPPRPKAAGIVPPEGDTTDYDLALAMQLQEEEDEQHRISQRNRGQGGTGGMSAEYEAQARWDREQAARTRSKPPMISTGNTTTAPTRRPPPQDQQGGRRPPNLPARSDEAPPPPYERHPSTPTVQEHNTSAYQQQSIDSIPGGRNSLPALPRRNENAAAGLLQEIAASSSATGAPGTSNNNRGHRRGMSYAAALTGHGHGHDGVDGKEKCTIM